jgi:hypothetical protein
VLSKASAAWGQVSNMPLSWALIAILALGNFATWGVMSFKERLAVKMAVGIERSNGIAVCNGRVSEIERVHNERVFKGVGEAKRAEELVTPAPDTEPELAKLCKASASCRSRGSL